MARYAPISRQDFLEVQLGGVFKREAPDYSGLKQYPICRLERSIIPAPKRKKGKKKS